MNESMTNNIIWLVIITIIGIGLIFTFLNYKPQDKSIWLDLEKQIIQDNTILVLTFNNVDKTTQENILKGFNNLKILEIKEKSIITKIEDYIVIFNTNDVNKLKEFLTEYKIIDKQLVKEVPLTYMIEIMRR